MYHPDPICEARRRAEVLACARVGNARDGWLTPMRRAIPMHIARNTGIPIGAVNRAIADLERLGLIVSHYNREWHGDTWFRYRFIERVLNPENPFNIRKDSHARTSN